MKSYVFLCIDEPQPFGFKTVRFNFMNKCETQVASIAQAAQELLKKYQLTIRSWYVKSLSFNPQNTGWRLETVKALQTYTAVNLSYCPFKEGGIYE